MRHVSCGSCRSSGGEPVGAPARDPGFHATTRVASCGPVPRARRHPAAGDRGLARGVDGVLTTRYRAQLDLDRVAAVLPAGSREAFQRLISKLESLSQIHTFPVEAWIDRHDLVRRMVMTLSLGLAGRGS